MVRVAVQLSMALCDVGFVGGLNLGDRESVNPGPHASFENFCRCLQ